MKDIIIVGAGPAGLTAAIYAGRAGMSTLVIDKNAYGGQIALTTVVDNFPGTYGIDGVEFATKLYNHATNEHAEFAFEEVTAVALNGPKKTITTDSNTYTAHAVILANGAARRKLGVPGEDTFIGRGVSFCATCDAAFFRGKTVAIVGGGDTALNDTLFLSNNCKQVYLIHRKDFFRAEKVKQEALNTRTNVTTLLSSTVASIQGEDAVTGVLVNTPDGQKDIAVDGVFVAIGLEADTSLYKDILPFTPDSHIQAGEDCLTPLKGVYVAGDIRDKPLRQIVTAAADGAVAAVAAAEYCNTIK